MGGIKVGVFKDLEECGLDLRGGLGGGRGFGGWGFGMVKDRG